MYVTEALTDYVGAFSQRGLFNGYIDLLENLYLSWALYDFITILALLTLQCFKVLQRSVAFHFIIISLTINAVLTLIIYYDLYVLYSYEPWWYWSVYSIGINTIDILMVLSLILNKKILRMLHFKAFKLNLKKP